jgi:hypothetical protein
MLEWALGKLLCVEPTGVAMVVEGRCMPGSSCFNDRYYEAERDLEKNDYGIRNDDEM